MGAEEPRTGPEGFVSAADMTAQAWHNTRPARTANRALPPMSQAHDPNRWRSQFPILETSTYLVNHSLGAMPKGVYDRLQGYADQWATRGVRAWSEGWWTSAVDVGNVLGRLMNAPKDSVVMHQNVSDSSECEIRRGPGLPMRPGGMSTSWCQQSLQGLLNPVLRARWHPQPFVVKAICKRRIHGNVSRPAFAISH